MALNHQTINNPQSTTNISLLTKKVFYIRMTGGGIVSHNIKAKATSVSTQIVSYNHT